MERNIEEDKKEETLNDKLKREELELLGELYHFDDNRSFSGKIINLLFWLPLKIGAFAFFLAIITRLLWNIPAYGSGRIFYFFFWLIMIWIYGKKLLDYFDDQYRKNNKL